MEALLLTIVDYHHTNEQLVAIASVLANFLLFTVIVHERNKNLRPYARLLLVNCAMDLVYTIVYAATELKIEFWNGYVIVNIHNLQLRSAPAHTHFSMAWIWTFVSGATINSSPLIFYFRYMAVCKNQNLNIYTIIRVLTIPLSYAVMEASAFATALHQHDSERIDLCPKLLNVTKWLDEDPYPEKCMLSNALNPFLLLFLGAAFVFDITIYTAMVYFSYGVYRVMKDSTYSWKTTQMQRQMNWMLFTQMFVPLFTAIIPVAVIMMSPILHVNIRGVGTVMCMCISWVPLVSPVTTITLVANFRQRAIRYLLFFTGPLQQKLIAKLQYTTSISENNNNNTQSNGGGFVSTVSRQSNILA